MALRCFWGLLLLLLCLAGMPGRAQAEVAKPQELRQERWYSNPNTKTASATVYWNKVIGAVKYQVAVSSEKNGTYQVATTTTNLRADVSGILFGGSKYVKVRALTKNETGDYCDPIEVVTGPAAPAAWVTDIQEKSITLKFSGDGATHYWVEYYPIGEPKYKQEVVEQGPVITLSTGNYIDRVYKVTFAACRASSNTGRNFSAKGKSTTVNLASLPTKITGLKCKADVFHGENRLYLSWDKNNAADRYEYEILEMDGKTSVLGKTISTKNLSAYITSLSGCGHYYARVRGYVTVGGTNFFGAWSDLYQCSTLAPDHSWGSGRIVKQKSCTEAGQRVFDCKYCTEQKTEVLSAMGHSWSAWTPSDAGHHKRVCANDPAHTETQPHSWDAGRVTREATVNAAGVRTYTCTVCSATRTESIDKLPLPADVHMSAKDAEKAITTQKGEEAPKDSAYRLLQLRSKKVTKNSITLKWRKVKNASGYIIYGNRCGKNNRYKKLKTIAKNSTTQWTQKKLKKGTYYKYLIVAVKGSGENQGVIATSKTVHVATKGGKVCNDSKVTLKNVKKNKLSLKKGKSFQIKAYAVPESNSQTVKRHRTLAFESSNPAVASVSAKGKISAKAAGSCTIYVYAQNGVAAKIAVSVK